MYARTILAVVGVTVLSMSGSAAGAASRENGLEALRPNGASRGFCPLKHTEVHAEISGLFARVTVQQQFQNPFDDTIEAVYVFPLSNTAAVDDMTMRIGERTIRSLILPREKARAKYERAKQAGKTAGLLDQERPNIFTQSVANIEPGARIDVTISYTETLDWRDGRFEFQFPLAVGPRYIPGTPTGTVGNGSGQVHPTDQVPDADRVTPPLAPPGTRTGHDVSIQVQINAGLPIRALESALHKINIEHPDGDPKRATVTLKPQRTLANRDFVLGYETAGEGITDTLLTHTDKRGTFFTLILQPPRRVEPEQFVPRELIFVIDKSGSMRGIPIETAKSTMRLCIENLRPRDTFNLMTFEGGVGFCFEKPVANTDENRRRALRYLGNLSGGGGTEMMKAIHACLDGPRDPERKRIVCFMTDGYVGNDHAIIAAVQKNRDTTRFFSFGIGSSVNRYLLDGIARAGRGEVQYVLTDRQIESAAEDFDRRVRAPVLTDVKLEFGDLAVEEMFPENVPDLFSEKPIVIRGRYSKPGGGRVTLRGISGDGPLERIIEVKLPETQPDNSSLATMWARAKVEHLSNNNLQELQTGTVKPEVKQQITDLGLRYRLATPFTSFVAVDDKPVAKVGGPRTVPVPIEVPQGMIHPQSQAVQLITEEIHISADVDVAQIEIELSDFGEQTAPKSDLLAQMVAASRTGVSGRDAAMCGAMVGKYGGNEASESAVAKGLKWLAEHQLPNGSWSFVHEGPNCQKQCGDSGTLAKARNGATALALLAFLGAGTTHQEGTYKETIYRALDFLIRNQKPIRSGGSFEDPDGGRYSHALATMALCEAYAMTHDKRLMRPAQAAVAYSVATRDQSSGGWTKKDGDPPDVVLTGLNLLALKSAHLAFLTVSPDCIRGVTKFLDSVQLDSGATYRSTSKMYDPAFTAIGLLCRLHLGWKQDHDALNRGIDRLAKRGPVPGKLFYDLMATQLLMQRQAAQWTKWNETMRDQLIDSQSKVGHEKGSWHFEKGDLGTTSGGRVYCTAMSVLILEVYYRHAQLFNKDAVEIDFPLK